MRNPAILADALRDSMPALEEYGKYDTQRRQEFREMLERLLEKSYDELIALRGKEPLGAIPTPEYAGGFIHRFMGDAPEKPEAVIEFLKTITSRDSVFVDGSEARETSDYNIPWGIVSLYGITYQKGTSEGKVTNRAKFLPPQVFTDYDATNVSALNHVVDFERWRLELTFLIEQMEACPGIMAVFDGSLVNTFAIHQPAVRDQYDDLMNKALATSHRTRSPLIGYINTSRSRDLMRLLAVSTKSKEKSPLHDVGLCQSRLERVGDRTCIFQCDRADGSLAKYDYPVNFAYAQLAPRPLAACRLEFPSWMDSEAVNEACRFLTAQSLAYRGYPMGISVCNDGASITQDERRSFRLFVAKEAQRVGLNLEMNPKASSKDLFALYKRRIT